LLEDAGVKLAVVASEVLGVSGRAMLEALLWGTTDPALLAELSRGKLRRKIPIYAAPERPLRGPSPLSGRPYPCSPGLSR
jgi:hypothetical protein